ncbi:hypothetical protein [Leifsonia sp. Leaf264]|uniref:hypothetical protein n=1 Tax=Leifsonia sp. Leaf264 TaxID=1736314 RepID=UPI0006F94DC9|nr:hypothetical protein [Leifsonia sp. Leaf264]KQO98676.1 hypothetical protein ASF30_11480 [Leifsonia sp. Leaf264]
MSVYLQNADGKLAGSLPQQKSAAEAELVSADTVTVEIAGGSTYELTPGVLNFDAEWAFQSGQCIAFASALSKRIGSDDILVYLREDRSVIHALAYMPIDGGEGVAYDIDGMMDLDWYERELNDKYGAYGWSFESFTPETIDLDSDTGIGAGLPTQNFEIAESMMDAYADLGRCDAIGV